MRRFLLPLGLAAWLCSPHATQAQPAPADPPRAVAGVREDVLTLDRALALAAQRSPLLSAARHQVAAAAGGVMQAGLLRNPVFNALVEDTRRDARTSTANIDVPLEVGGQRAARIGAASAARRLAEAELTQASVDLKASVTAAFFDVLVAQERLSLANDSAALATRGADAVGRRVAAGKVSPVDETRARIDQDHASLEVAEAETALATARQALSASWGDGELRYASVDGDVERLVSARPAVEWRSALDSAPTLLAGQLEIARRRALLDVEKTRRVPDLTFTVGVKRDHELGRTQGVIGLSVPLPYFDRNQGNILEAASRSDGAEDDYRALRIRVLDELQRASNELTLATRTATTLKTRVLPASEDALHAVIRGFEAGKFGFLDVLDAQRSLLTARARYLAALSSSIQAATAIDRLLGR